MNKRLGLGWHYGVLLLVTGGAGLAGGLAAFYPGGRLKSVVLGLCLGAATIVVDWISGDRLKRKVIPSFNEVAVVAVTAGLVCGVLTVLAVPISQRPDDFGLTEASLKGVPLFFGSFVFVVLLQLAYYSRWFLKRNLVGGLLGRVTVVGALFSLYRALIVAPNASHIVPAALFVFTFGVMPFVLLWFFVTVKTDPGFSFERYECINGGR